MATYKKRGSKSKSSGTKLEQLENKSATAGVFNTLDEGASKTEQWVANNQRNIFLILGVIAVTIIGYLAYDKYVQQPNEIKAMNEMYTAQTYFESANNSKNDSLFNLSLKGADGKLGMLDIIDNYSGTKASNLANYYAGMAYYNIKDYRNSIKHLNEFKSEDEILSAISVGSIGDSYSELNLLTDAFEYYSKAFEVSNNDFTTPMYLLKAGYVGLEIDKANDSYEFFMKIKSEFPNSIEATNIDALIGMASSKSSSN